MNKIQDGKPDWFERVARAYLYTNNFRQALNYLQTVPSTYHNGVARIQEAACLIGIAASENDALAKRNYYNEAKEKLRQGIDQNKEYWKPILAENRKDSKWPMKKEITLLRPVLTKNF